MQNKIEQEFKELVKEIFTTMSDKRDLIINVDQTSTPFGSNSIVDTQTKEKEYFFVKPDKLTNDWNADEIKHYLLEIDGELLLTDSKISVDKNDYERILIKDGENKVVEFDTKSEVVKIYEIEKNDEIKYTEVNPTKEDTVEKKSNKENDVQSDFFELPDESSEK